MSALADTLRALASLAAHFGCSHRANDVLREHAPCEMCDGRGQIDNPTKDLSRQETWVLKCPVCGIRGWTHESVEAAISRAEERDAEVERLRKENAILHKEREACWKEVRGYPLRDDCLPDGLPDRIREIVKDANQKRAGVLYSAGIGRSAGEDHGS